MCAKHQRITGTNPANATLDAVVIGYNMRWIDRSLIIYMTKLQLSTTKWDYVEQDRQIK